MKQLFFPSKLLIAILIIFSIWQISYSQNAITLGLKGGIIYSQYIITGQLIDNSDFCNGISVGISVQLLKRKNFMLMPEIYYLQRGMGYKINPNNYVSLIGRTKLSCLSIVILPSYRFENKILSPYFFTGPRLEFVLNQNESDLEFFYNFLNKVNFGFSAGLGFEKEITNKINISGEFRYSRDFTNFRNSSLSVGGEFSNYTNSSFDFLLGVNFALGSAKK